MGKNLTQKIIAAHLVQGRMQPGAEIALRIDQTLVHDATGQMALLQYEAIGAGRVKTKRSLTYCDHNTLQVSFENMDDHHFLASASRKFGLHYSRVGNGICHQVNLERFSVPGQVLLGADSHTTTAGGVGMLAIGAGGLDVAVAMAGEPFFLPMPRVLNIRLTGVLPPWSAAKDVALEILRRLTVSGGRGKILEFSGEGVKTLSATERATIANMSIETGAVTALFPSDEITQRYFSVQERAADWTELAADPDAAYDEEMEVDLGRIEHLGAHETGLDLDGFHGLGRLAQRLGKGRRVAEGKAHSRAFFESARRDIQTSLFQRQFGQRVLDNMELAVSLTRLGPDDIQVGHLYAGVLHQNDGLTLAQPILVFGQHGLFLLL